MVYVVCKLYLYNPHMHTHTHTHTHSLCPPFRVRMILFLEHNKKQNPQ